MKKESGLVINSNSRLPIYTVVDWKKEDRSRQEKKQDS